MNNGVFTASNLKPIFLICMLTMVNIYDTSMKTKRVQYESNDINVN